MGGARLVAKKPGKWLQPSGEMRVASACLRSERWGHQDLEALGAEGRAWGVAWSFFTFQKVDGTTHSEPIVQKLGLGVWV